MKKLGLFLTIVTMGTAFFAKGMSRENVMIELKEGSGPRTYPVHEARGPLAPARAAAAPVAREDVSREMVRRQLRRGYGPRRYTVGESRPAVRPTRAMVIERMLTRARIPAGPIRARYRGWARRNWYNPNYATETKMIAAMRGLWRSGQLRARVRRAIPYVGRPFRGTDAVDQIAAERLPGIRRRRRGLSLFEKKELGLLKRLYLEGATNPADLARIKALQRKARL